MPCAVPLGAAILGGPEVDTSCMHTVRILGVHGECQVIPGLATGIHTIHCPSQQVGALSVEHAGLPIGAAVGAAPESGKSLVAVLSRDGIDRVGGGRREGECNTADSEGSAVKAVFRPGRACIEALGDEVAELPRQQVLRVGRVAFKAGVVAGQGADPVVAAID